MQKYILSLPHISIAFKCPLFVKLFLLETIKADVISGRTSDLEIYKPTQNQVGAKTSEVSKEISEDINKTIDALVLNSKAYQMDGCDKHVSHLIMPISIYTEFVMTTSLLEWSKLFNKKNIPSLIKVYIELLYDIINPEWKHEMLILKD